MKIDSTKLKRIVKRRIDESKSGIEKCDNYQEAVNAAIRSVLRDIQKLEASETLKEG